MMEYSKLSNGIELPKIMLGSFNISEQNVIDDMVKASLEEGENGFDTSPSYGSEKILGTAIRNTNLERDKIFISDKIDGWQMYKGNGEIEKYVNVSLTSLQTDYIDLLLVHWPFKKYLFNTWKCMENLYKSGKVRSIGLCNMDCRTYSEFLNNDIEIKPHVIQIEISPFRTACADIETFQNEGILIQAYSPMCRMIKDIRENTLLLALGEKYNKTVSQIILRWHLDRGIVPIFTSSKPSRIKENLDVFDFALDKEDVEKVTSLNKNYKIFPESFGCPGY